jgi:hypothetical protein
MAPDSHNSINKAADIKGQTEAHGVEYTGSAAISHDMTPEEERKMVRKMDFNIFPIVIALYILSFLDRVNIGKPQSYSRQSSCGC